MGWWWLWDSVCCKWPRGFKTLRQFVPAHDQQVYIILKIKIGDELFLFYVWFDIRLSGGQVVRFLGTLYKERKECVMWRMCVFIWTQPQWLNCWISMKFDVGVLYRVVKCESWKLTPWQSYCTLGHKLTSHILWLIVVKVGVGDFCVLLTVVSFMIICAVVDALLWGLEESLLVFSIFLMWFG